MDTEEDYNVAKLIVQSGQSKKEWDSIRQGKGIWPVEKETWKQFRAYSLQELKDEMKVYKQSKGNVYFLCISLMVNTKIVYVLIYYPHLIYHEL